MRGDVWGFCSDLYFLFVFLLKQVYSHQHADLGARRKEYTSSASVLPTRGKKGGWFPCILDTNSGELLSYKSVVEASLAWSLQDADSVLLFSLRQGLAPEVSLPPRAFHHGRRPRGASGQPSLTQLPVGTPMPQMSPLPQRAPQHFGPVAARGTLSRGTDRVPWARGPCYTHEALKKEALSVCGRGVFSGRCW